MTDDALLDRLCAAVGARYVETDPDALAPHLIDWRKRYRGTARARVRPGTTEEVAAVVAACAQTGTPIVPQGGETGLVGGGVPDASGTAVILATDRLNRVRAVDPANNTMTVEAGCILQTLQRTAEDHGRLFPLSLTAEGICRIGGNLATNAGGLNVLKYGTARDQVLGLEVVLADGSVWDGLRRLRKDTSGYDLKHLFIGAEGTLGIITAAVLRLHPQPRETATAYAGVPDVEAALAVLNRVQEATGHAASSFELMARRGVELAVRHVEGARDPLGAAHPWTVLVEVTGGFGDGGLRAGLERALMAAHETGETADVVMAENAGQARAFWHLREAVVEAQRHEGASIKHDIAVPVSAVPAFLAEATPAVEALIPGVRPVPFGHLGDGNLHFNLTQPEGADPDAFLSQWETVNARVHDIVHAHGGTVSAEHGVGQLKMGEIARFKPPEEMAMLRAVKRALDPHNLMNPGRVVAPDA